MIAIADISKTTLAILIILVIILSIAGTWVAIQSSQAEQTSQRSGLVTAKVREDVSLLQNAPSFEANMQGKVTTTVKSQS